MANYEYFLSALLVPVSGCLVVWPLVWVKMFWRRDISESSYKVPKVRVRACLFF